MSLLPDDIGYAGEFLRRLRYQCEMAVSHQRVCASGDKACATGALIQLAIRSTIGDLKALGYTREATMIITDTADTIERDRRSSQEGTE